jgi:CRP/FNR family transcriptional regulator
VNLDSSAFIADKELIDALEKRSIQIVCEEDRDLFRQGEMPTGLFILHSGKVTITMKSPMGEDVMCFPAALGSVLGLPGLIGNQPYTLTAFAAKGTALSFVSREDFSNMMLTEPSLSLRVLRILAAEVRTARHALSAF